MSQSSVLALPAFEASAVFHSKQDLYSARDRLHQNTGYKLVTANTNQQQVIFNCHQRNAVAPKVKCTVQVRANFSSKKNVWKISPRTTMWHLCLVEDHPNPMMSKQAVALSLQSRIITENETLPTASAFVSQIKRDQGQTLSVSTAYRGMKHARDLAFGTEEESFRKLDSYLAKLVDTNPGSKKYFDTDGDGKFVRAGFIAPYAATFLGHGIPCTIVDMAHFRKTKYPGMAPSIVGKDGENHLLPLAWGVCASENEEEYRHLFQHYRAAILEQDSAFSFQGQNGMGDGDKGQLAAAQSVLADLNWTHCVKHKSDNIGKQFKGCGLSIRAKFCTAMSVYTKAECQVLLDDIRQENAAVHEYVVQAGLSNYARSHTDHSRLNVISSQAVESWHKVTKPYRALPRLPYFQKVEHQVQATISKRKADIEKAKESSPNAYAVPSVTTQIAGSLAEANHYDCMELQTGQYAVFIPGSASKWTVDLDNFTCGCGRFQEIKAPCVHALSAIKKYGTVTIQDCLHKCYKISGWEACYSVPLNPIGDHDIEESDCLPPPTKRNRGRPKGSRFKSRTEIADQLQRVRRCKECGQPGHNAADCGRAFDPQIELVNCAFDPKSGEVHL